MKTEGKTKKEKKTVLNSHLHNLTLDIIELPKETEHLYNRAVCALQVLLELFNLH